MLPLFEHVGRIVHLVGTDLGKPAHFICVYMHLVTGAAMAWRRAGSTSARWCYR